MQCKIAVDLVHSFCSVVTQVEHSVSADLSAVPKPNT